MLALTRRPTEEVIIGERKDQIILRVVKVINGRVTLQLDAPAHIEINRSEEVYDPPNQHYEQRIRNR